jgi:uncharacterized membrane protein
MKLSSITELLVASVILVVIDIVFLSVNRKIFEDQIIEIQRVAMNIKLESAIMCYLLLIAGYYWFILRTHRSPMEAFFLGILVYGVYETTSYALLKKWKLTTVIVDTLWGGILLFLTTFFTYAIYK